jgi:hypothetical protein
MSKILWFGAKKLICKGLPTLTLSNGCINQQSQVGKGVKGFSVIVKNSDTDRGTATEGHVDKRTRSDGYGHWEGLGAVGKKATSKSKRLKLLLQKVAD